MDPYWLFNGFMRIQMGHSSGNTNFGRAGSIVPDTTSGASLLKYINLFKILLGPKESVLSVSNVIGPDRD